jgi:hypothetical protein
VRNLAYTLLTLNPPTMATMTFNPAGSWHNGICLPPVRLVAEPLDDATPQHAPPPAVLLTCHPRAEIQVLQLQEDDSLWQSGLPIDVS